MMGISLSKALGCTQQLSSDHLLDMRRPDLSQRQILLKYGHDIQGSLSRAPKSKILLSLLRINQCEKHFWTKVGTHQPNSVLRRSASDISQTQKTAQILMPTATCRMAGFITVGSFHRILKYHLNIIDAGTQRNNVLRLLQLHNQFPF